MQRASVLITALVLLAALAYGIAEMGISLLLYPTVTAALIALGGILIILQLGSKSRWGVTGLAGLLCIGSVIVTHVLAEISIWYGTLVLLLGILLLIAEARVIPGHGIGALTGTTGVFLGTYWTIGGAEIGTIYSILISLLASALAFMALLTCISRSKVWRELSQNVEMKFVESNSCRLETSEEGTTAIQTLIEPCPKLEHHLAETSTEEPQQIITTDPE